LPLDVDHGMDVASTIGSFRPYFDGDKLMMAATFADNPKAQEVRALIRDGHINTVSVAFMNDKAAMNEG
jgi:phage head maturation protease